MSTRKTAWVGAEVEAKAGCCAFNMRALMACLCRHAGLEHQCQDIQFTVHSGPLLSRLIGHGKVLWVLMEPNTGSSTTCRTTTRTIHMLRLSVGYC